MIAGIVYRHSWNFGDVPSWITAVTTTLVVVAGAAATIVAYRLYQVESARDVAAAEDRRLAAEDRRRLDEERAERRRADQRAQVVADEERAERREADKRAQPNKVAAWFGMVSETTTGTGSGPPWGAVIRNASDLPVLSVRVFFHYISAASPASEEWRPVDRGGPAERIRVIRRTRRSSSPFPTRSRT